MEEHMAVINKFKRLQKEGFMKFRFNLILVFTLIFILGVFCVSSCKKANEESVEATEKTVQTPPTCVEEVIPLINDTVASETQFADPSANYNEGIRDLLAAKICEDLDYMNGAFAEGRINEIVDVLRRIRRADTMAPITAPGQIISYFQRLKNGDPITGELPVQNFGFQFAGAVVVPVNTELNPFPETETNFISFNTYIFTFDRSSGSESTDPAGSGGGDTLHRRVCTWE
jgi:hypothetical protein